VVETFCREKTTPVAAVLNDGAGIGQKPVGVLDALGDRQRSSAYCDE
jgi:hypothetical protein